MKTKITVIITSIVVSSFLISCGSGGENKSENDNSEKIEEKVQEVCKYAYDNNTEVKWTAFKFTERVGVGGTLDSFVVKTAGAVEEPYKILNGLEFEIYTASVNSNNPSRDKKITSFFFGKMENSGVITGKILEFKGSPREGDLMVSLTLNGKSFSKEMKYFVEGNTVTINGQIDMVNWDAQESVDALNNVCLDLHTGKDGASVLWSDVDIEVVSVLKETNNSPCKQL